MPLRSRAVADLRRQAGRAARDAGRAYGAVFGVLRSIRVRRTATSAGDAVRATRAGAGSRGSASRAHWRNFDCVRSSCACRYASHSLTMPTNSDFGSANSACALSAAPRWSAGRSRGSWMPRKAAIASISRRQPRSLRGDEHARELHVDRQARHRAADGRELARALVAVFDRAEFEQLLPAVGDRARIRRFEEREFLDAPQAQRQHAQDHAGQRGAADFRIGEARRAMRNRLREYRR